MEREFITVVCLRSIIHSQWPASQPFLGHFISNRSTVLNVYSLKMSKNQGASLFTTPLPEISLGPQSLKQTNSNANAPCGKRTRS